MFKASVDPDIRFFGFDLTVNQARGAPNPQSDADDWGYYFIIQQLPGEPRFGMDVSFSPDDDSDHADHLERSAWDKFPDDPDIHRYRRVAAGLRACRARRKPHAMGQ